MMSEPSPSILPVTVLLATRNEEVNLPKCLASLRRAARVLVLDSGSQDKTCAIAEAAGAEVVSFHYQGGYPRKRQWALESIDIGTPWILFVDADEEIPPPLWDEIAAAIKGPAPECGYVAKKEFHFLGRRFRFGGFSHTAVLLVRRGMARYERLVESAADGFDMEVHERVIVEGRLGRFKTAIVHCDFKGLDAYKARHHGYAAWEAALRRQVLASGRYGVDAVRPRLFGNVQERRRFLKLIAMRIPFEPVWWFLYHYVLRLGFLEGRAGFIACQLRYAYIREVNLNLKS